MGKYDNVFLPWSQWKVTERLGKGGFGTVYEAERELFGKKEKAAIKVLTIPSDPSEIEEDYSDGYDYESIVRKYTGFLRNIVNEYQLMADLKGHTNIVNCHDIATIAHKDGIGWDVYIRMELLTPLQKLLRTQTLTTDQIIKLGMDICSALIVCEKKKIVHRDIKPENILISEYGDYKLGDFGIARNMDHATAATKIGTERYIAPEVLMQNKYDRSVDIYSLGLVLHWLLNERKMPFIHGTQPPSAAEIRTALNRRLRGEPLPDPVNGSTELNAVIRKACAYKSEERYRSAQEMLNALQAVRNRRVCKKAEPFVQKSASVSSKILGIHFGVQEVCVSVLHEGRCRNLLKIPAYVAITPAGETLSGSRAIRYKACHEKTPLYSAIELLKANKYTNGFYDSYKGADMDDIFVSFAKEIRRKLDETAWKELDKCILSVTSCPFHKKEKLRSHMSHAGFNVYRIVNTAAACSYSDLYARTDDFHHIGFVLEGKNIELSFVENSKDVFEVIGLCSLTPDQGQQIRTSVLMKLLEQKCPDYKSEIEKAKWIWYGDHQAMERNKTKVVQDVGIQAAAGAALYGAQLLGEITGKLCLLTIPNAYGIEIAGTEGKNEQQLLKFQWLIGEQTTIPARSKEIIYERKPGMKREETLKIYGSVTKYGDRAGLGSVIIAQESLQKWFAYFSKEPDKVGISLSLDANEYLTVVLRNLSSGEKQELLFSQKHPVQSRPRTGRALDYDQILTGAGKEMKRISQSIEKLDEKQKATPVGNGLLQIEKQCKKQYEKVRDTINSWNKGIGLAVPDIGLANDLLQIVDSMEYGVRAIAVNSIGQPERILINCYHSFLKFLENSMEIIPIPAEGEYFDAKYHYALMYETDSKKEENIVSEELQRGYYMGMHVLRPAKVKVVN